MWVKSSAQRSGILHCSAMEWKRCKVLLTCVMAAVIRSLFSCWTLTLTVRWPPMRMSRPTPLNRAGATGDGFAVMIAVVKAGVEVPPVVDQRNQVGHEAAGASRWVV
jgi:hypothetical protein